MAAISLFWDTNMTAVTSCENTLLGESVKFARISQEQVETILKIPRKRISVFFQLITEVKHENSLVEV